jgi:hypothetical protein
MLELEMSVKNVYGRVFLSSKLQRKGALVVIMLLVVEI